MSNEKTNTWLLNEKGQIESYINEGNVFLIERKRCIKILIDLIGYHFKDNVNLNVLDLGCGDGIITKYIYNKYPDNNYILLDGSTHMLNLAKEKLGKEGFKFINQTFQEFISNTSDEPKYDVIFSSNAIHHLDYIEKMSMYVKIHEQLKSNGMFINIDLTLPTSAKSEELQFEMWKDWINETLEQNNKSADIGRYDNISKSYKRKSENKLSKLTDQMDLLQKAGFGDVDCFYKYSMFTVFGGIKY